LLGAYAATHFNIDTDSNTDVDSNSDTHGDRYADLDTGTFTYSDRNGNAGGAGSTGANARKLPGCIQPRV
jgi:hypothetical protein